MDIYDLYRVSRDNLGIVGAVNEVATGKSLPFPIEDHEDHDWVIELRAREAEYGELDLSDRIPESVPVIIGYRINSLLSSDRGIPSERFPGDINYNTELVIGLTTQTIDYFGLRVAQVFYQSIDSETKEPIEPIPIVFERYKYNWDTQTKLPTGRVKEIYFYQTDGNLAQEPKLLPKEFYNVSDRADIVTRRRQTILAWLIARATELGLGAQVKDYFAVYKDKTDKYVLYGDTEIINTVQTSTQLWLDLDTTTPMGTVRNAILTCFTKALQATPDTEVSVFLDSI